MMWTGDRELEEHQVYDHFSTVNTMQQLYHPNGGMPNSNGGAYAHLQQQHSSTPTTTNSMGMESSLGGGSPPPMTLELDHDGPLHQHATLPAVDHRLPTDNHHIDDQDIYSSHNQHLYQQPHHLMASSATDHQLMLSSSSSCLGGCGDQETAMMMQSPNGDSDLVGCSLGEGLGGCRQQQAYEENKMISKPAKEKKNYLLIYAREFGLNDRGCYVAVCLAALAFLLFVIVIAMGVTWPGKPAVEFCVSCPCFLGLLRARSLLRWASLKQCTEGGTDGEERA